MDKSKTGYDKPLFILPFDHRSSFTKGLYTLRVEELSNNQREEIKKLKEVIYDGFKNAISNNIPKEHAAILIDEEFGKNILKDARKNGFNTCLTTEKTGQNEFDFAYKNFQDHIEKIHPNFVKALVKHNPEGNRESNKKQVEKLKILNDYCRDNGYYFLFELLVPSTDSQLESLDNNKLRFEEELRPQLTLKAIEEVLFFGIEPDVWKIEGQSTKEVYEQLVSLIKKNKKNAGIVVLGRGEDGKQVEKWITQAAKTNGVTGFAIGRTIFWQPILDFHNKKITREEAVDIISKNYQDFYQLFIENQNI